MELVQNGEFQVVFLEFVALQCVGMAELWKEIQAYKKASERVIPNMARAVSFSTSRSYLF